MGIDEYRKEQAEYMKKYRAKQRALKIEIEKKQKAYTTLTDAMRAKKARIQVNKLRNEKERQEKVKNDVSSIKFLIVLLTLFLSSLNLNVIEKQSRDTRNGKNWEKHEPIIQEAKEEH